MLIQNATGNSVPAPSVINDHAGSPVVSASAPQTDSAPVTLPQKAAMSPAANTNTAQPSGAQLLSAVDKLNQAMRQSNTGLEFSIDSESKKTLIKVVDSKTGETIKQIPSKEVIAISQALDRFQQGLLLKQKA